MPVLTHEVEGWVTNRDDAVSAGERLGGELGRAEQDHEGIGPHGTHCGAGETIRVAHFSAGWQLRRLPDCRRAACKHDRALTQQLRARQREVCTELGRGRRRADTENDSLAPSRADVDGVPNGRGQSIRKRRCDPRAELRIHADQEQEVHIVETPQRRAGLRNRLRSSRTAREQCLLAEDLAGPERLEPPVVVAPRRDVDEPGAHHVQRVSGITDVEHHGARGQSFFVDTALEFELRRRAHPGEDAHAAVGRPMAARDRCDTRVPERELLTRQCVLLSRRSRLLERPTTARS